MTSGAEVQSWTYEIQTVEVEGGISDTAEMAAFEYGKSMDVKMTSGFWSR
jgi:hypothetical protein